MIRMTKHGQNSWTLAESLLAAVYLVVCLSVGVFAFIEIYFTVTHLLHPWMGDWAWIVPAAAEGLFTGFYAGWLLLDLKDTPPPAVVWLVTALLAASAGGSYWLNIYAAHGAIPDVVGHVIVVTAFYGVLLFAKVLVQRLKVSPAERAQERGMADARQYAVDLVRAVKGRWWRWRGDVPSLLRRQITSGRLCDAVRSDVQMKVSMGRTSGWEETVRGWVFGPDGLALAAVASEASKIALSELSRSASQSVGGSDPAAPSESASGSDVRGDSARASRGDKATPSEGTTRRRRIVPAKATDDQLADLILAETQDPAALNPYQVNKILKEQCSNRGVGETRAAKLVELAQRQHREHRVVSIGSVR